MVFERIKNQKDQIVSRTIKAQINQKLKKFALNEDNLSQEKLKTQFDNMLNQIEFDTLYKNLTSEINEILTTRDYPKLLKYKIFIKLNGEKDHSIFDQLSSILIQDGKKGAYIKQLKTFIKSEKKEIITALKEILPEI